MSRARVFAAACAAMFLFGVVLAILGALFGLPEMRLRLGINLAQQGDVFLALLFGVFVSTLIAGPVIDSFGSKLVLIVSAALVAVALASFIGADSYAFAICSATLLGFGGGGLNTASNALVADIYPENRGAMLNFVATFFGIGALLIPLVAATVTAFFSITNLLVMTATLATACAFAYTFTEFPPPRETVGFSFLGSLRVARMPGALLFAVILFCQSGNESSIGGWMSTYAWSLGATPRTATWILAGYWAALMFGRILAARALSVMTHATLVRLSAIGSAIGCATVIAASSTAMLAIGSVVTGLSFAAIYPTMLAMAADRYDRMAGAIFGFLFAAGLIGGMLFPFAVGHIAQRRDVRSGMIVPLAGAVAIAALGGKVRGAKENMRGRH